ncbi:hypothetical protein B0T26DRAFT_715312 [Lasiosphaeria miniovina]|uniref:Secreted protein n=1 Tax=Lasiosphaeria miniovina TaxID=1954250 RepID=A0AA40DTF8_9PEZI|nr:uncharacterized protein B0T26DRAFT_715312 [Lasiosphaeria miniovina]KAK0712806.1 hypothetical protein B0T26DRAFT_715312 [Lasiosphaeria miniovina]
MFVIAVLCFSAAICFGLFWFGENSGQCRLPLSCCVETSEAEGAETLTGVAPAYSRRKGRRLCTSLSRDSMCSTRVGRRWHGRLPRHGRDSWRRLGWCGAWYKAHKESFSRCISGHSIDHGASDILD